MSYELFEWVAFNTLFALLLGFDLFWHRKAKTIRPKEALCFSLAWITLALLFSLYIFSTRGGDGGLAFLAGYLVEKSLSVDNLFVFLVFFQTLRTPSELLHKVLFWGIIGAILLRATFIYFGITLIQHFPWVLYLFGIFLIYLGIHYLFFQQKKRGKNRFIAFLVRHLNVVEHYEKGHFFVKREGKLFATPLFIVLIAIELSDLIFAVDSIPAILAITQDPFIAYTSNILAVAGLRALFFLVHHLLALFVYLHYSLASILIFIGLKLVLSPFIHIPIPLTLTFIAASLSLAIFFSKRVKR